MGFVIQKRLERRSDAVRRLLRKEWLIYNNAAQRLGSRLAGQTLCRRLRSGQAERLRHEPQVMLLPQSRGSSK